MGMEVKDERPGCPACKYLQRACLPDCSLAKHFPPESEPHFAVAKAFLGNDNPAELVIQQLTPEDRLQLVDTIVSCVTDRGRYSPAATSALDTALCATAIKRYCSRLRAADLSRGAVELFGRPTLRRHGLRSMRSLRTTTSEALKEDKSLGSPDLHELLKIYEEPEVRRGGRWLSPADGAVMARIWHSFVEAMELPLPVAVMELQQSGVLPFDEDCDEHGPSDQDREEQKDEASSSGTKNEGGGNNHDNTP